jgi:hypothetical protein
LAKNEKQFKDTEVRAYVLKELHEQELREEKDGIHPDQIAQRLGVPSPIVDEALSYLCHRKFCYPTNPYDEMKGVRGNWRIYEAGMEYVCRPKTWAKTWGSLWCLTCGAPDSVEIDPRIIAQARKQSRSIRASVIGIRSEIADYHFPLGDSSTHCMTLGVVAYPLDIRPLLTRARNRKYYLVHAAPSFETEDLLGDYKIDLGVKRAELNFSFKSGIIGKDRFPNREEEKLDKEMEYEYGVTVSAKGELEFKPFVGSIGPEAKWRRLKRFTISSINTYCYSVGMLTAKPGWIFQPRMGENHLEGEKEVMLIIEVPKGKTLSGQAKMFGRDLVLLDENHRELSWRMKFVTKIKRLILKDEHYKPIMINLKKRRYREVAMGVEAASRAEDKARNFSARTLTLIKKELKTAKTNGLL